MEDWFEVPAVDRLRRAHEALAPAGPDDQDEPSHRAGEPEPVNLFAPEHRDKLRAMFQWAAEGRRWDEVRDQAVAMVFPQAKPPAPR